MQDSFNMQHLQHTSSTSSPSIGKSQVLHNLGQCVCCSEHSLLSLFYERTLNWLLCGACVYLFTCVYLRYMHNTPLPKAS